MDSVQVTDNPTTTQAAQAVVTPSVQTQAVSTPPQPVASEKIVYPEEYVKELRNEAAAHRVKASEFEKALSAKNGDYELLLNKHNALIDTRKAELIKSLGIPEDKHEVYRKMDIDALELISKDFAKPILNSLGADTAKSDNLPSSIDEYVKLPVDQQNALYIKYPAEIGKLLNI